MHTKPKLTVLCILALFCASCLFIPLNSGVTVPPKWHIETQTIGGQFCTFANYTTGQYTDWKIQSYIPTLSVSGLTNQCLIYTGVNYQDMYDTSTVTVWWYNQTLDNCINFTRYCPFIFNGIWSGSTEVGGNAGDFFRLLPFTVIPILYNYSLDLNVKASAIPQDGNVIVSQAFNLSVFFIYASGLRECPLYVQVLPTTTHNLAYTYHLHGKFNHTGQTLIGIEVFYTRYLKINTQGGNYDHYHVYERFSWQIGNESYFGYAPVIANWLIYDMAEKPELPLPFQMNSMSGTAWAVKFTFIQGGGSFSDPLVAQWTYPNRYATSYTFVSEGLYYYQYIAVNNWGIATVTPTYLLNIISTAFPQETTLSIFNSISGVPMDLFFKTYLGQPDTLKVFDFMQGWGGAWNWLYLPVQNRCRLIDNYLQITANGNGIISPTFTPRDTFIWDALQFQIKVFQPCHLVIVYNPQWWEKDFYLYFSQAQVGYWYNVEIPFFNFSVYFDYSRDTLNQLAFWVSNATVQIANIRLTNHYTLLYNNVLRNASIVQTQTNNIQIQINPVTGIGASADDAVFDNSTSTWHNTYTYDCVFNAPPYRAYMRFPIYANVITTYLNIYVYNVATSGTVRIYLINKDNCSAFPNGVGSENSYSNASMYVSYTISTTGWKCLSITPLIQSFTARAGYINGSYAGLKCVGIGSAQLFWYSFDQGGGTIPYLSNTYLFNTTNSFTVHYNTSAHLMSEGVTSCAFYLIVHNTSRWFLNFWNFQTSQWDSLNPLNYTNYALAPSYTDTGLYSILLRFNASIIYNVTLFWRYYEIWEVPYAYTFSAYRLISDANRQPKPYTVTFQTQPQALVLCDGYDNVVWEEDILNWTSFIDVRIPLCTLTLTNNYNVSIYIYVALAFGRNWSQLIPPESSISTDIYDTSYRISALTPIGWNVTYFSPNRSVMIEIPYGKRQTINIPTVNFWEELTNFFTQNPVGITLLGLIVSGVALQIWNRVKPPMKSIMDEIAGKTKPKVKNQNPNGPLYGKKKQM
jgi:hypothetical protein